MSRIEGFWRPPSRLLKYRAAKQTELHRNTIWPAIRTGCLALAVFCASMAFADVCPVPNAAHPSIQAAVDDAACTEIVLAAQVFAESVAVSRSLVLRGDSSATTVIEGQVTVTGNTTEIALQDLQVNGGGCFSVALDVGGGAGVTSQQDVMVTNSAGGGCQIFLDGFESGNTSAWSSSVP